MKYSFQIITLVLLIVSFTANRQKTVAGLKIAYKRFLAIAPTFVVVILVTSLVLGFVAPETIQKWLGGTSNRWLGMAIASVIGSIAVMPGFIAFPLGSILRGSGVLYMVISAFTTTLMMVGIVTFPIEKAFLGTRVALLRNGLGLIIALVVALGTGIAFNEVLH